MSIRKLNDDLNVISALSDEPSDVDGLSADELKASFDKAGNTIKTYINGSLIPDVESEIIEQVTATTVASGNLPAGGKAGQSLIKKTDGNFSWDFESIYSVPAGGRKGYILAKKSDADHDTEFVLLPTFDWVLQQSWKTAGAHTWTAPDLNSGQPYEIGVFIVGGGGSGGLTGGNINSYLAASGGAGGYTRTARMKVAPGSVHNLVVGAGGAANQFITTAAITIVEGKAGGTSSFDGITAAGGYGGRAYGSPASPIDACGVPGADGGQGSDGFAAMNNRTGSNPIYNYHSVAPSRGSPGLPALERSPNSSNTEQALYQGGRTIPGMCQNPFTGEYLLAAGGGAGVYSICDSQKGYVFEDGTYSGDGDARNASSPSGNAKGGTATALGSGGGAAVCKLVADVTVSSGAGAAGGVFVYARRFV